MHSFSETEKLSYRGIDDDGMYFLRLCIYACGDITLLFADAMFHFTCFNVDDPQDPSVGLIDGQLAIPGNLLRREVFDPVVGEVHLSHRSILHGSLMLCTIFRSSN